MNQDKYGFEKISRQKINFLDIDERFSLSISAEIIKKLVTEYGMSGVILCLCRPSGYMHKIIENMRIPSDGIYYIDAVGKISGMCEDNLKKTTHIKYIHTPFDIDIFIDSIYAQIMSIIPQQNFIIIDDVVSMLLYWDIQKIRKFLNKIKEISEKFDTYTIILTPTICKIKKINELKNMVKKK